MFKSTKSGIQLKTVSVLHCTSLLQASFHLLNIGLDKSGYQVNSFLISR